MRDRKEFDKELAAKLAAQEEKAKKQLADEQAKQEQLKQAEAAQAEKERKDQQKARRLRERELLRNKLVDGGQEYQNALEEKRIAAENIKKEEEEAKRKADEDKQKAEERKQKAAADMKKDKEVRQALGGILSKLRVEILKDAGGLSAKMAETREAREAKEAQLKADLDWIIEDTKTDAEREEERIQQKVEQDRAEALNELDAMFEETVTDRQKQRMEEVARSEAELAEITAKAKEAAKDKWKIKQEKKAEQDYISAINDLDSLLAEDASKLAEKVRKYQRATVNLAKDIKKMGGIENLSLEEREELNEHLTLVKEGDKLLQTLEAKVIEGPKGETSGISELDELLKELEAPLPERLSRGSKRGSEVHTSEQDATKKKKDTAPVPQPRPTNLVIGTARKPTLGKILQDLEEYDPSRKRASTDQLGVNSKVSRKNTPPEVEAVVPPPPPVLRTDYPESPRSSASKPPRPSRPAPVLKNDYPESPSASDSSSKPPVPSRPAPTLRESRVVLGGNRKPSAGLFGKGPSPKPLEEKKEEQPKKGPFIGKRGGK